MFFSTALREYYEHLHLSRNIKYLYLSRLLIQVAAGLLTVFTVVFLYEQFGELYTPIALIFGVIWISNFIGLPLVAQYISRLGMRKMIITSIFFLPLTVLSLVWLDTDPVWALTGYLLFGGLYRYLYWTPYHIDFAKFTNSKDRGKQISLFSNISEVALSIMPYISGVLLAMYNFDLLFILASTFLALSIIPLFFIDDIYEKYEYGYWQTYTRLFSKQYRSSLIAFCGDGVQSGIRIVVWPLFIYVLLSGDYQTIGLVTSLTIILLIILRFIVGKLADSWSRSRLLRYSSFFATTGWLFKTFVESSFQIIIADTYHKLGTAMNRMSADVVMYDHATDNGHYIDEYTILSQLAVSLGRATFLFASIWIVAAFGLVASFVVAALATLAMSFLNKEHLVQ